MYVYVSSFIYLKDQPVSQNKFYIEKVIGERFVYLKKSKSEQNGNINSDFLCLFLFLLCWRRSQ